MVQWENKLFGSFCEKVHLCIWKTMYLCHIYKWLQIKIFQWELTLQLCQITKMHLTSIGKRTLPPAYQGDTERRPPAESVGFDSSIGSNTDLECIRFLCSVSYPYHSIVPNVFRWCYWLQISVSLLFCVPLLITVNQCAFCPGCPNLKWASTFRLGSRRKLQSWKLTWKHRALGHDVTHTVSHRAGWIPELQGHSL